MRDCQACAHGQELQVNTTSVPFAPFASAIERLLPSTLVILTSALGALLPIARALGLSPATAVEARSSAARANHRNPFFMSPPRQGVRTDGAASNASIRVFSVSYEVLPSWNHSLFPDPS